jgi:two-component system chemotaxis response regulator CheV
MSRSDILLETGTNELEIVEFHIDEQSSEGAPYVGYYGINVAKVLEIIRMPQITEMPSMPHPCLLGAFNMRGHVIPLIDLSRWLGKDMVPTDAAKVIVTEFNNVVNAFMVSGVTRIHRLSWNQIEPPSEKLSHLSSDSITGVVKMENRVIFLLDMEKIVADLNPGLSMQLDVPELPEGTQEDPFKALIADDSTSIRHVIAQMLEKSGFAVTRTINGQQAWDQLLAWRDQAAREDRPITDFVHIVVSDIEMPAMDGHNLTKRIKEDTALQTLPVVLFSSLITDRLRHKGESVGADEQISKPDLPNLTRRARELIHDRLGAA